MTAEIAVMNSQAVALAADSAVTSRRRDGGAPKIFNTATKLFALSKHAPVGVMFYGTAEICGVPVETAVKMYRRTLGSQRKPRLSAYALGFLEYLHANEALFDPSAQESDLAQNASVVLSDLQSAVTERVQEDLAAKKEVTPETHQEIVETVITLMEDGLASRPDLSSVTAATREDFERTYSGGLEAFVRSNLDGLPLATAHVPRLVAVIREYIVKKGATATDTGIVIAGFGEEDIRPALSEYRIRGVAAGHLLYDEEKSGVSSHGIFPFAQREMVNTFIEGISPGVRSLLQKAIDRAAIEIPAAIVTKDLIPGGNEAHVRALFQRVLTAAGKKLQEELQDYVKTNHIGPVVNTVAILPKHELAEMAETLVNLTSFKQRVSPDAETVGGPIDVAVISKGDGFVWIKRKHYFRPELNHQFFRNYNEEWT